MYIKKKKTNEQNRNRVIAMENKQMAARVESRERKERGEGH